MKIACLRVDVDGFEGLRKGTKNIVDLILTHNVKGTFFVNMGIEASIADILGGFIVKKSKKITKSLSVTKSRYTLLQNIRRLILPINFGKHFCKSLKFIIDNYKESIEIEPHAWNHFKFSHYFPNMDIKKEIEKIINSYINCFGEKPIGYAPPSFNENKTLYRILKNRGIKYISSRFGGKPFKLYGLFQIPLSIRYSVEETLFYNLDIQKIYFNRMKNLKYFSFYIHADAEGINDNLFNILENIILALKREKYSFLTMKEIYSIYGK